jgi:predicted transcriptional regulator
MRTYTWVLLIAVSTIALSGTAAALPTEVERLLDELDVDVDARADLGDEQTAAPQPEFTQPQVSTTNSLLAIVSVPVEFVGTTLMVLGLNLVLGLFQGMGESSAMVAEAAKAVVAQPAESVVLATLSIAVAGLAGALSYLLRRFGSLGAIPLYTRIAKSELLENGIRQQIMEIIQQNPGINVSEISRRLDIAWGTATHHLQKLRHEKLVNIRIASNQKCYFPNGGTYTPHEMDVMSAIKNPTAKQIAEFLVKNGPKCHGDISEALQLTPALVSFHMQKLVGSGVVARHRQGRNTIFTPLEANLEPSPRAATAH